MPQDNSIGRIQAKIVANYATKVTPVPTNGHSPLSKLIIHWITDKVAKAGKGYRDETRRSWQEFAHILRINHVTDINQLDGKRIWRSYRSSISTATLNTSRARGRTRDTSAWFAPS